MSDSRPLTDMEKALRADRDRLAAKLAEVEKERDEARKHLDGRLQWQAEAALNLQTFRALFDAACLMREGHEGCVTEPVCGDCFRCNFDKAVDQAKIEVAAGVDEFIQESLGYWGRFAAKMQKERDTALRERDEARQECDLMRPVYEAAVKWRRLESTGHIEAVSHAVEALSFAGVQSAAKAEREILETVRQRGGATRKETTAVEVYDPVRLLKTGND